jgi:hypothetical protein
MDRLEFLKTSAATLLSPYFAKENQDAFNNDSKKTQSIKNEAKNNYYHNKNTRLTIAMWDFSWLTDQGKGGSYEDIEKRVEEAAERGYNTLRIDCFPSRLLEKETSFSKGYNSGEGSVIPCWGKVTTDFSCNALQKLKQLSDACRKNNIWLGLDSWEKGHMMGHKSTLVLDDDRSIIPEEKEESALRAFAGTWVKAIRLMREEGVLERAVWVAPMNEVPHFASRSLESIRRITSANKKEGEVEIEKNNKVNERFKLINHWMGEEIKESIKKENIPLSYSSLGGEEYAKRLTDIYDVVDVHFMPDVIIMPDEKQQFEALATGASGWLDFQGFEKLDLKKYSKLWDMACRNNYAAMLKRTQNYLTSALENITLPNGKRMQAVITESFGPCFWPDHPDMNWEWYKHYNGDSARVAASMPFEGISLSNYAEPLFTLWNDADWHRNANLYILNI